MDSIELFKIFSEPMPEGSRMFTIHMDVVQGKLLLLNRNRDVVEETDLGLLWCQSPTAIGKKIINWFRMGYPVETVWAYPALTGGPGALGFFIQGCARMAERMSRT